MHLVIAIALGAFGGLWLFTRWAEARTARIQARQYRRGMELLHPHLYPETAKAAASTGGGLRTDVMLVMVAIFAVILITAIAKRDDQQHSAASLVQPPPPAPPSN